MFSELIMRLGLERVRETVRVSRAVERRQDEAPVARHRPGRRWRGTTLVDVLLGGVARDGASTPTALPTPVADRLRAPGARTGRYTIEPVDDPMHDYAAPHRSTRRGPAGSPTSR